MPLLQYHGVTNPVITITNDAGGKEEEGETCWEFVDNEMLAGLPADLTDPLLSLNAALRGLREICGPTAANITLSIVTVSAWSNTRAFLAVPEFIRWVETGSSSLSSKKAFQTPIAWPEPWKAKLEATDGYSYGNMQAPRLTLTLTKGLAPAAASRLDAIQEGSAD